MTIDEKLEQAYWYSCLLTHVELAKLLSDKPNLAMKRAAKAIETRCPVRNIRMMAAKLRKQALPSVWLERQHKIIKSEGMTVEDYIRKGLMCGELIK